MATLTAPRFLILQSDTYTNQYFYLVFMDLPPDTDTVKYSKAVDIEPSLNGTELVYTATDFDLPQDYDGDTTTYCLKAFEKSSSEGIPNIQSITFKTLTATKKGDTGGASTVHLPEGAPPSYVLKDRVFAIISNTSDDSFFVGGLVDFPANVRLGDNLHLKSNKEYEGSRVESSTVAKTFLAYSQTPATYDKDATPTTATVNAIFVNGFNDADHKGVLLDHSTNINVYKNALTTNAGIEVNAI